MKCLIIIGLLIVVFVLVFCLVYLGRLKTIFSMKRITNYSDDYNLYTVDIKYNYSLEKIINYGIENDQSSIDAITKESFPLLPIKIKAPSFGCTAFTLKDNNDNVHMGRNYDFMNNTSAMLVRCTPKNGYKSVAFAALDNISANVPEKSLKNKFAVLTSPFICLDGINEKGVSIAVLTLDSKPTRQNTGKPTIATPMAIRFVLDRASTTEEAVNLLKQYDMYATSGRDYHFYITDSKGDGRVVEYDCHSKERKMVDTKTDVVTNFFMLYKDKVKPNCKNGIYGHGKERYDIVNSVLDCEKDNYTDKTVEQALKLASQEPSDEPTSNTQWSIDYNNTNLTAKIALRRRWTDWQTYDLKK